MCIRPSLPTTCPIEWRFDLNPETNPYLMEELSVNSVFNPGAIKFDGRYFLMARVEEADRKSFFTIAESPNGVGRFQFWDEPAQIPETIDRTDTNGNDMRLIPHQDGWIYGVFCTEKKDLDAPSANTSAAGAQCGNVRTKDLESWERLPTVETPVLDAEGSARSASLSHGKEVKNGQGSPPIKTEEGRVHVAHGVRETAAGLRYVHYIFMTALDEPSRVTHQPGGHVLAPRGRNGWGMCPVSSSGTAGSWTTARATSTTARPIPAVTSCPLPWTASSNMQRVRLRTQDGRRRRWSSAAPSSSGIVQRPIQNSYA